MLKENITPSYHKAWKLPVHLLSLVVEKLRKLMGQELLEHVPLGSSRWASPIVVLRKSDEDIRICADYRIGVNHKIYLDLYLLPNVEVTLHALAGMSVFAKIDLKTVYHQIPIDNNFKDVMTINTPIG